MKYPELFWLAASALFTACLWIPYIINRMAEHGVWRALKNPDHDDRPKAAWADRLMWAHTNAVENLVVFAALILALHVLSANTEVTNAAAMTYFFVRVAHAFIYTAGIPVMRTLTFVAGFVAQVLIALTVLSASM